MSVRSDKHGVISGIFGGRIAETTREERDETVGSGPEKLRPEKAVFGGSEEAVEEEEALESDSPGLGATETTGEAEGEAAKRRLGDGEDREELVHVLLLQRHVVWGRRFDDDQVHVAEAAGGGDLRRVDGAVLSHGGAYLPEPPLHGEERESKRERERVVLKCVNGDIR